jgi:glycosyltransferase involved in cell wall biosynthesis
MTASTEPLVSVVTPAYNGQNHLSECIESVLAQTYNNWEYVIVNNCSTDRTLEIAQNYAQKDKRIRVHNNSEFLSIIQNWNQSLRLISTHSKYCKEVHADDLLFPHCIERMVEVAEDNPTVAIVGSYALKGNRVKFDGLPYPDIIVSGQDICRSILRRELFVFGSPTSLLMRADIIRSRESFYDESYLHADTEVCFDFLQDFDFGFVHQVLSYTRLHEKSQSMTFAEKYQTNVLDFYRMLLKYGPIYFSADEYKRVLKQETKRYYRTLVKHIFSLRNTEFLSYHKNGLKNTNCSFNTLKLLFYVFLRIQHKLLNPKNTIREIIVSARRCKASH